MLQGVHAVDLDTGSNGEVEYEAVGGDMQLFAVNRATGQISAQRVLAPSDEGQGYSLVVQARDKGQGHRKWLEVKISLSQR